MDAADVLAKGSADLNTQTGALLSGVNAQVDQALALQATIATAIDDLQAFPDHSDPAWIRLSNDLAAAADKAQLVVGQAKDIARQTALLLQAAGQVDRQVGVVVVLAHEQASAATKLNASVNKVGSGTDHVFAQFAQIQLRIRALSSLATQAKASAKQAQASAQQSLEKAQASAQQALGAAQQALAEADSAYARLLALDQIAVAHRLPGGNATGATVQKGGYLFRIDGTRR